MWQWPNCHASFTIYALWYIISDTCFATDEKKDCQIRSPFMLFRLRALEIRVLEIKVLEIKVLETLATSGWRVDSDAHAQRRGG